MTAAASGCFAAGILGTAGGTAILIRPEIPLDLPPDEGWGLPRIPQPQRAFIRRSGLLTCHLDSGEGIARIACHSPVGKLYRLPTQEVEGTVWQRGNTRTLAISRVQAMFEPQPPEPLPNIIHDDGPWLEAGYGLLTHRLAAAHKALDAIKGSGQRRAAAFVEPPCREHSPWLLTGSHLMQGLAAAVVAVGVTRLD